MGSLAAFILGLPLNPEVAARYGRDPASTATAAGLTAAERLLLSTGSIDLLVDALRSEIENDVDRVLAAARAAPLLAFLIELERTGDFQAAIRLSRLSAAETVMLRTADLSTVATAVADTLAVSSYARCATTPDFVQLIARTR